MKRHQNNSLESLLGNSNKLQLIKSYKTFQTHIDLECERTKNIVRNSLSDLLDIPNSLEFLYNEQFLDQLTLVIRQIYKRYFQLELSQKYSTFTKHLFFLFQSICEQIINEQHQIYDDYKFGKFQKSQESPPRSNLNKEKLFQNDQKVKFESELSKKSQNQQSAENINHISKNSSLQLDKQNISINLQIGNQNYQQKPLNKVEVSEQQNLSNSIQNSPKQAQYYKNLKKVINRNTSWQKIDIVEPENQLELFSAGNACTFSQSPRFDKKREPSPGPCDYNVERGIKATKINSPAFQISQQQRKFDQFNHTVNNPGPQAYNPSIRFKSK